MIDIAQALQHPTEDRDWIKKFALGVLISFVPILSFAITGFIIEHLQNSARGASSPLPNWDNLGNVSSDLREPSEQRMPCRVE